VQFKPPSCLRSITEGPAGPATEPTSRVSGPPFRAVASKDGGFIYALAPEPHKVLVIKAAALEEKYAISVGKTPALALVAP